MHFSANGFSDNTLTFSATEQIAPGTPVKLSDNFTVTACGANDVIHGVVRTYRENRCAVQLKGAVTLPYSGTAPTVGTGTIASDGNGGVKKASDGSAVLILSVDTVKSTITCIL